MEPFPASPEPEYRPEGKGPRPASIIGVGLAALFAYFIGKGANWARIVYTVLIVIGVLGSLAQLGGQPPVLLVLSLVSLAIGIAIVVFLYRPDSNAYFKKKA